MAISNDNVSLEAAIDKLKTSNSAIASPLIQVLNCINKQDSNLIPHESNITHMFDKSVPSRIRLSLSGMATSTLIWAGNKFHITLSNLNENDLAVFYEDATFNGLVMSESQSIDARFVMVQIDPFGDKLARFVAIITDDDKPPSGPVEVVPFEPTFKKELIIADIIKMLTSGIISNGSLVIPRNPVQVAGF